MRKGRVFIYLALIIILLIGAGAVYYVRYLSPAAQETVEEVQPTPVVDLVNVVFASQSIPRGQVMDADVLKMVPIQRDLFIDGMFTTTDEIEGRMAKFDLEAGIPLTRGMLVDEAEQLSATGSLAALAIPRGMVAVSIPISQLSSVSYAPKSGDHVNVIVTLMLTDLDTDFQTRLPNNTAMVIDAGPTTEETGPLPLTISIDAGIHGKAAIDPILGKTLYEVPAEDVQRPRMVSQALLQDAVVLKAGNFPYAEEEEEEEPQAQVEAEEAQAPAGATPEPKPKPKPPGVITLIVTPQDAVTLNYLMYSGAELTLALRSVEDDSRVEIEAVTLQFLLDQYEIPVPLRLPYGIEPRIDQLTPAEPPGGEEQAPQEE